MAGKKERGTPKAQSRPASETASPGDMQIEARGTVFDAWLSRFRSLHPGWIALALAAAVFAAFWPVTGNEFVNYDDPDYVTANAQVQRGLSAEGVAWAFRTGHASNWHPLTWISHQLDCQLFGVKPAGHHLTSLVLHALTTALLFLALRQLTGATWRSAFVAALFGLHPLRVESVAWISERKDVLSGLFWMLTLLAYAKFAARSKATGPRSAGFYLLALGAFALGLMSKPMLVTLPFVLLLLDYWPLGRLQRGTALKVLVEKLPFFALAAASSIVTFLIQRKSGAVAALQNLPLTARIDNALISYARYLGKTFWPQDLSVLYPHPGFWPRSQVWMAAAFLLGVSIAAVALARRRPYFFVGWFWFVGTLVPVIGLVQVGIQSMADRYTYVPLIGIFIIVAWGVADCVHGDSRWRWALAAPAALAILVSAGLTRLQVGFWQNSETLFRHAVVATKDNYLAYNNLGFHFSSQGKTEESLEMYQQSLRINPNYEEAHNNLGFALAKLGRPQEAVAEYLAALRLKPDLAEAHNNLGNALAELGRGDEAIAEYTTTLRLKPDHADAHSNLGIALAMRGQLEEAITHFHRSLAAKPNNASVLSNLGNALAAQRKFDEAIRSYEASLRLNPNDSQAHNNLGNVLATQRNFDAAIREYEAALRINPKDSQVHNNLASVLATQGKLELAAQHFGQALQSKPDNPEAHLNLATALLRLGQREPAMSHVKEALRQRPNFPEAVRLLQNLTNAAPEQAPPNGPKPAP